MELERKSLEWFTPDTYAVIDERDPNGPYERRVRVVLKKPLPAESFAVLIGDVLYSLRSALDNLAYDLNGGDANTKKMANKSEFPIFGNENRAGDPVDGATAHNGTIAGKIFCMCDPAKAIIKGLQPYNRGNRYTDDSLWQLHTLCNIDKHRKIHTVAGAYSGIMIDPARMENFSGNWDYWSHTGPLLDTETVIARYTAVPKDPKREVRVNLDPMLDVGLAEGSIMMKHSATWALQAIQHYVINEAIKPLENFV